MTLPVNNSDCFEIFEGFRKNCSKMKSVIMRAYAENWDDHEMTIDAAKSDIISESSHSVARGNR